MSRKKHKSDKDFKSNFVLRPIGPESLTQKKLFDLYESVDHLILHGYAGTGKTFISLYLALREIQSQKSECNKVIIIRSSVQGRDQGHLPGNADEKMAEFETPYINIFNELFGRGDAYSILKKKKMLEVMSTSFNRGLTLDNCIIVVDEAQNMNFGELDTILTRVGLNTRLLICGDIRQTDLVKKNDKSGLPKLLNIIKYMDEDTIETVEFEKDDIIRSGFVKEYIIAKEEALDTY